jgi:hypothetical protein
VTEDAGDDLGQGDGGDGPEAAGAAGTRAVEDFEPMTMAFLPSSFIAATASVVWAVHLALCSHAAPRRRGTWLAAAAGILGGFATGCHLIAFPMLLALLAAVLLPRAEEAEGRPAPASVIPRTRFIVK